MRRKVLCAFCVTTILTILILAMSSTSFAESSRWVEIADDLWANGEDECSVSLNSISDRWEFGFGQTWVLRTIEEGNFQFGNEASFKKFIDTCGTFDVLEELIEHWETRSPKQHKRPEHYVPAFLYCSSKL